MKDTSRPGETPSGNSEFWIALRNGALIGVALLAVVVPATWVIQAKRHAPPPAVVSKAQPPVVTAPPLAVPEAAAPAAPAPDPRPLRLADFRDAKPSKDATLVANWAVYTRDNGARSIVVIDKKFARVYVFGPEGRLIGETPALLGSAVGDHTVPGIGEKPLEQVKPDEKTTPAGRFIAQPGKNLSGEDIVWVDYDAAVSMHRVRPTNKAERRLERLASATHADNRISFGCINLPVKFYEGVLSPNVRESGAVVYVLPEVRTPEDVFGAWDVTSPLLQARHAEKLKQVSAKVDVQAVRAPRQDVARPERI
ncbi:hypothetical protein [Ramlibacter sp.]|uniref:hypothetical protein n=1 Tax=Ramlibacter sp. TaxID=1917967 RepID=UPI003D0F042B